MKYASIIAAASLSILAASCENKENRENTSPPGQENSMKSVEARFAADMVGVDLGKYLPVEEARKTPAGTKVHVKGVARNVTTDDTSKVTSFLLTPLTVENEPAKIIDLESITVQILAPENRPDSIPDNTPIIVEGIMADSSTEEAPVINSEKIAPISPDK